MTSSLPERLQEIVDDFAVCEGREKLEYLLYFSEQLEPLPAWLEDSRDQMEQVDECVTPVFVHAERQDGRLTYYFDVPAESPTVRGFAAFMAEGTRGASPEQVMSIPDDFFVATGLNQVLTMQRLNGLTAILANMKRLAAS